MDDNRDNRQNKVNEEHMAGGFGPGGTAFAVHAEPRWFIQARNIIYYILGVIEVLLAFRFIFKLLGASTASPFVAWIYSLTRIFAAPFFGIFRVVSTSDSAGQLVFEPATLIAMLVYAIAAKGIVELLRLRIVGHNHK